MQFGAVYGRTSHRPGSTWKAGKRKATLNPSWQERPAAQGTTCREAMSSCWPGLAAPPFRLTPPPWREGCTAHAGHQWQPSLTEYRCRVDHRHPGRFLTGHEPEREPPHACSPCCVVPRPSPLRSAFRPALTPSRACRRDFGNASLWIYASCPALRPSANNAQQRRQRSRQEMAPSVGNGSVVPLPAHFAHQPECLLGQM